MVELVEVSQHIGPGLCLSTKAWAQLQFCRPVACPQQIVPIKTFSYERAFTPRWQSLLAASEGRPHHPLKSHSRRSLFALSPSRLLLLLLLLLPFPPLASLPPLDLTHQLSFPNVRHHIRLLSNLQAASGEAARPKHVAAASETSSSSSTTSLPSQGGGAATKRSHVRRQA